MSCRQLDTCIWSSVEKENVEIELWVNKNIVGEEKRVRVIPTIGDKIGEENPAKGAEKEWHEWYAIVLSKIRPQRAPKLSLHNHPNI